jgi:hypothetical protein
MSHGRSGRTIKCSPREQKVRIPTMTTYGALEGPVDEHFSFSKAACFFTLDLHPQQDVS